MDGTWTRTDEAPLLATYAFLPVVRTFAGAAVAIRSARSSGTPSRTSRAPIARPTPLAPPVITAMRPANSSAAGLSSPISAAPGIAENLTVLPPEVSFQCW